MQSLVPKTSFEVIGKDGVFNDEGDGGDIGLFKGIEYRYLNLLVKEAEKVGLDIASIKRICDIQL